MQAPPSVKYGFYSNTLGANRVRLRFPPQAAPAQGANAPMDQSREAHFPARLLRSSEGAKHSQALPNRHRQVPLKAARRSPGDCHRASSINGSSR